MNALIDPTLRADAWNRLRQANALAAQRAEAMSRAAEDRLAANATKATRRKLRRDVVQTLWAQGRLSIEQLDAAEEIARVWKLITAGLFARCMRYDREVRSAPSKDWRPSDAKAYTERYIPWRDHASTRELLRPGWQAGDLVLTIVNDNYGIRQAADRQCMDQRTVLRHLQSGLWLYADLAGWVHNRQQPAA